MTDLSKAMTDVIEERRQQTTREGYSDSHDDSHLGGELALAGAAYAINGAGYTGRRMWPWSEQWWKPKSKRQDLVRAAALVIAEIERLDRAEVNDAVDT